MSSKFRSDMFVLTVHFLAGIQDRAGRCPVGFAVASLALLLVESARDTAASYRQSGIHAFVCPQGLPVSPPLDLPSSPLPLDAVSRSFSSSLSAPGYGFLRYDDLGVHGP